mmetsp:Transcript_21949/g.62335  ORF Transcript_21949/g.62335 Transcript_21949/m.62335 type:complete len:208 (-) Transcript_21949:699-1322(-)
MQIVESRMHTRMRLSNILKLAPFILHSCVNIRSQPFRTIFSSWKKNSAYPLGQPGLLRIGFAVAAQATCKGVWNSWLLLRLMREPGRSSSSSCDLISAGPKEVLSAFDRSCSTSEVRDSTMSRPSSDLPPTLSSPESPVDNPLLSTLLAVSFFISLRLWASLFAFLSCILIFSSSSSSSCTSSNFDINIVKNKLSMSVCPNRIMKTK